MHNLLEYDLHQATKQAWHNKTDVKEDLTLENCWLRDWDIVPVEMMRGDDVRRSIDAAIALIDEGQDAETILRNLSVDNTLSKSLRILTTTDQPKLEIGTGYNADTFKPISNEKFLEMIHNAVSGTDHKLVSCGSVRNRGRVFASFALEGLEDFEVAGRKFESFLNFGDGRDKSSVLWVSTSNICTVCDNTFTANLHQVEQTKTDEAGTDTNQIRARVRHSKNVELRLPELANMIDKAVGVQAQFKVAMEEFSQEKVNVDQARTLFAGFIGSRVDTRKKDKETGEIKQRFSTRSENTVHRLTELFQRGAGNEGETLVDVFQAGTEFYTHESTNRDRKEDKASKQFASSEFGAGALAKEDFFRGLQRTDVRQEWHNKGAELVATMN